MAATTLPSSINSFRSPLHSPSQFPILSKSTFSHARLYLNPKCNLRSKNSVPQNGIVCKPSPLELLETSAADSYTKERSSIIAIGLNFRTAPVEIREKLAIPEAQWPHVIGELCALNHIEEAAVLSTCNRTEIYVVALSQHRGVKEVTEFMSTLSGVPIPELSKHRILLYNREATQHLLEVAAGLDSLVLGEGQILAQVKQVVKAGQILAPEVWWE